MCGLCDYSELLKSADLEVNPNRLRILEILGANNYPLSVNDIFTTLERNDPVNRTTVYRILDLLVDAGLVERLSTGGRSFYYGLAPNHHHRFHAHFYCRECGQMECLSPDAISIDMSHLKRTFSGRIDKLEIRIDGVCKNCMK